jgi:hypothetical protein
VGLLLTSSRLAVRFQAAYTRFNHSAADRDQSSAERPWCSPAEPTLLRRLSYGDARGLGLAGLWGLRRLNAERLCGANDEHGKPLPVAVPGAEHLQPATAETAAASVPPSDRRGVVAPLTAGCQSFSTRLIRPGPSGRERRAGGR